MRTIIIRATLCGLLVVIILCTGCSNDRRTTSASPSDNKPEPTRNKQQLVVEQGKTKKQDGQQSSTVSELTELPELKVAGQKVSLTWHESGKPRMTAIAQEVTGNTVSGKAVMKRVTAEFYDGGKVVARMTAPIVEADEKTRMITATGGVTITSAVPESTIQTVKSNWIKWYSREDKMIGNGGVTATGPVADIKAAAFTADTRLKTVKLTADTSEARAVIGR